MSEETTVSPVAARLKELDVPDDIAGKIETDLGVKSVEDLPMLTEADLLGLGMKPVPARKLAAAFKPAPAAGSNGTTDPEKELGEDEQPSQAQMAGFANSLGIDPATMLMFMGGNFGEMDMSGMIPIATIVSGYNPKLRNMFLMVMGQIEKRLGVPIVVIDGDGAINKPLTIEYIEGLEEGRDPAENNIYFASDGTPHEVIRVGVDAQSIYDADPLEPTKALQKSGMGVGRVNWTGVSLEVRQVAYYAATKTGEIDPKNDAHTAWLRDHVKKGTNRLIFHGQAPRAIGEYNEAARTGSLPTLRVMLSRGPRRPEIMPRRRSAVPHDVTGVGGSPDGARRQQW